MSGVHREFSKNKYKKNWSENEEPCCHKAMLMWENSPTTPHTGQAAVDDV